MGANSNIRVTVLMPVYNASLYLAEAIQSILDQTFRDFEFIIINDGSTDNSLDIIRSFKDQRIRLINNEQNLGIIASRNLGVEKAQGRYIVNMDADDISMPQRIEKQLAYMEAHPETVILASRLVLINGENEETGIWPEDYHCISRDQIQHTLPIINCIGQPTIMMRADVVKHIKYNKKFIANEDWGLWLEILAEGYGIAKLPDILLHYRQHTSSTTAVANQSGVEKKVIAFKLKYLQHKLAIGNFKLTDKQVTSSLIKDIFRFVFKTLSPGVYAFTSRVKYLDKKRFIAQFKNAKAFFGEITQPGSVVYFFPAFHTGGAERVHASIMEAANTKNAFTFITGKSANKAFLPHFSNHSRVLEIDQLLLLGFSYKWICKKIIKHCVSPNTTLLGCNSRFFYQLIPQLSIDNKVVDLTHAFVHAYEDGPEKWSLPIVERINQRIVINHKTKSDYAALYAKHNISEEFLLRIKVIGNFTETIPKLTARESKPFKVAYVGRGGEEKRIHLIAEAAKKISSITKDIEFHFVGDMGNAIPGELKSYCIIHDEINNEQDLQKLYSQFHLLIIASSREGFPMVIMEAMMQGVVPVSTAVGGIPEHISDNENGKLVFASGEEAIVNEFESIIKYLDSKPDDWKRLSINAHHYALANFSKTDFMKSWSEILGN